MADMEYSDHSDEEIDMARDYLMNNQRELRVKKSYDVNQEMLILYALRHVREV